MVAAHTEGLVAHKTIRSIEQAADLLAKNDIDYEILVTLDRPDEVTRDYFSRYKKGLRFYEVDFGDLAASRNLGVQKARGKYIALVDADDLVSKNWFLNALKLLRESSEDVILHTEYSINFGTQNIIWHKFDSQELEREALMNVQANQWDSAIVASKSLLEHFPFQPNLNGFGPEDWHFNCQTLAAGVVHKVVPNTVLFVRRKDVSTMTIQRTEHHTMHYTNLLRFDFIRSIDPSKFLALENKSSFYHKYLLVTLGSGKKTAGRLTRFGYHLLMKVPFINAVMLNVRDSYLPRLIPTKVSAKSMPLWLLNEWRSVNEIEKQLFPDKKTLATTTLYVSEMYELGLLFWRLVKYTVAEPDYILLVPYLSRGGADLFAINYANTMAQEGRRVAVIATEQGSYEWATRLNDGVDFVPFGRLASGLPPDLQLQVLIRFIIQSRAKVLHIIHSHLAYDLIERYRKLFDNNGYIIFANAFCDDVNSEGRVGGHVHTGLPRIYGHTDKIFTDNLPIIAQLANEYGFTPSHFTVHHQPMPLSEELLSRPIPTGFKTKKLLWAGRISKQKRPDLLMAIANAMPSDWAVSIDVYGSFQDGYKQSDFAGTSNINYKGKFNLLYEIPTDEYLALLYTSERDGLPNVLLEAASLGLPSIAPNIGGIAEIVTQSTGILIEDHLNINEYVAAVKQFVDTPNLRNVLGNESRAVVTKKFSQEVFVQEVKRDIERAYDNE